MWDFSARRWLQFRQEAEGRGREGDDLLWLCFFAVPLGLGAGAVDTALNNYVALHYTATHMSFLHCFYGVGVSLSPYLM